MMQLFTCFSSFQPIELKSVTSQVLSNDNNGGIAMNHCWHCQGIYALPQSHAMPWWTNKSWNGGYLIGNLAKSRHNFFIPWQWTCWIFRHHNAWSIVCTTLQQALPEATWPGQIPWQHSHQCVHTLTEQNPHSPQSSKTGVQYLQGGDSVPPKSISGGHSRGLPCLTWWSRCQLNQCPPQHHLSTYHWLVCRH